MATDMKNTILHVIFDLDDGRWPGGRYLARQCMQVARGRDFVRPGVRLELVHTPWPRRWRQADGDQQGEGQLELHHELYQAGGGRMQVHQLLGGKEPLSLFSPPRGARDGSWWSSCVCSISLGVTS